MFTEPGFNLPLGDAYAIEPYAGLAWNQVRTRDFEESGGTAVLHGKRNSDGVTSTTLALRGAWEFGTDHAPGRLTASLGWRQAMGDVKPSQQLAFDGGSTFTVTGVPIARNTAAGIAYDAQFGGGNLQQSGLLKLAVRF